MLYLLNIQVVFLYIYIFDSGMSVFVNCDMMVRLAAPGVDLIYMFFPYMFYHLLEYLNNLLLQKLFKANSHLSM